MKGYLSDEEIRAAYERWCNGEDPSRIAERYYISESTLWRGFKRLDLKKSRRKTSKKCDSDKRKK